MRLAQETHAPNYNLVKPTYGFIDSTKIIERFASQNWHLHSSKQANVRSEEKQGFQKHLLHFRNPDIPLMRDNNGNVSIPELVLLNSHDGTSRMRIFLGILRMACMNGVLTGTAFSSMGVVHSRNAVTRLDESIDAMSTGIPALIDRVNHFSTLELSNLQTTRLARRVADIRLSNTPNVSTVDLQRMLIPKRNADVQQNAYTVFNVLQEKAIRGGIGYNQVNAKTGLLEYKTSRAISSVSQNVKMNRLMWDALEEVVL